ncbi:hypothetical protein ACIRQP_28415 [Streptomyces sp. NPDC102274]|uniref:hypothetical protein n=1 Tax=Streptomyces sp. NPDC102274 TaxID=3366151 RepID=UPI00380BD9AC
MNSLRRKAALVLAVSGIGAFVVGVGSAVSGAGPSGLVWLGALGGVLMMVMGGVTSHAAPAGAEESGHSWWADGSSGSHSSGTKEPEPKEKSGTESGGCGGDGGGGCGGGCGGCGGCGG